MTKHLLFGCLAVAVMTVLVFGACAPLPGQPSEGQKVAGTVEWRMATAPVHIPPEQTEDLLTQIRDRSGGRLTISTYRPADLGFSDSEALMFLSIKIVEIAAAGHDTSNYPWLQLQNLPYLVESHDLDIYKALASAQYPLIEATYQEQHVIPITPSGLPGYPSRLLLFSRRPVDTLRDLRGLKIRTAEPIQASLMQALNANPAQLMMAELYLSVQTNLVDGALVSPATAKAYSLSEVGQNFIGLWPTFNTSYYGANQKAFDKLPPDVQSVLLDAFANYSRQAWNSVDLASSDRDWEAFVQEKELTYFLGFSPEEQAKLINLARSLWLPEILKAGTRGQQWQGIYEQTTGLSVPGS